VPVYITYLTARPDGDKLAFADDVYKLDAPAALVPEKQLASGSVTESASETAKR
jgi:murein L,D-transpeptidase YcbB/YkuD